MPIETHNHSSLRSTVPSCSIHPQGWVPIETLWGFGNRGDRRPPVAFTPKGGCPLKLGVRLFVGYFSWVSSIHPQGWVPIETAFLRVGYDPARRSSIHPQGWVPIETFVLAGEWWKCLPSSIHPQGWVPIETWVFLSSVDTRLLVAFTPKGGCPLKHIVDAF